MTPYADYIFLNGPVLTVDRDDRIAETVAVKDNRIVYVGPEKGLNEWIGDNTKKIDLCGRTLMPGFIDAHMHLGMMGLNASVVIDCNSDDVKSVAEIKEKLRTAAAKTPKGTWIKAAGYEQNKMTELRHPSREELDEVTPDHPVQLLRCCGHMGVYNSLALEAGKIRPEDFQEGEVVVDESGKMTGLLKEAACTYMWTVAKYSDEEYKNALRAGSDILLSYGITSMHDAGFYGPRTMGFMQDAALTRHIPLRIYSILYETNGKKYALDWVNQWLQIGIKTGLGNEHFKLGPLKILLDGSSSGPSSATKQPYSHDPELKGLLLWDQEEVTEFVKRAHNGGFQVTVHAVGDQAVELILSALEIAINENPKPHRHRIEHCALIDENQLSRIKKAGIIPVSNPGFLYENAAAYVKYYGERVNMMFPLKSYLDNEIITALGSDSPVISPNPMFGLYGALCRKDKHNIAVAGSTQAVGIKDAIRMYTYNGAYAAMEEDIKGSIEEGKLADLIILSENILATSPERLPEVKTDLTMLDGKIVYERKP